MDPYLLLKTLHLLGMVLFVGNVVVTGFWKAMADRTREPRVIAFAQRQVALADWIFTLGGVVLLAIGGPGAAASHAMPAATPWLLWGYILFGGAGIVWLGVLVPLQTVLGRMAKEFAVSGIIPARYWRLERLWMMFGAVATVLPIAAIPVMVFKFG